MPDAEVAVDLPRGAGAELRLGLRLGLDRLDQLRPVRGQLTEVGDVQHQQLRRLGGTGGGRARAAGDQRDLS